MENVWNTYGKLMEKIRFVLNIGKTPEEAPHGLEDHFPIIRWPIWEFSHGD
jgi:hypothetical protein